MSPRTPRSFTPDQQRAISATNREVLVVAPAGSGKTEVLIQRVVRTLEHSTGEAFRLLVVTFTVKAAEELKQRARESTADELWRVDADTIHGFALDWLKRYGRKGGRRRPRRGSAQRRHRSGRDHRGVPSVHRTRRRHRWRRRDQREGPARSHRHSSHPTQWTEVWVQRGRQLPRGLIGGAGGCLRRGPEAQGAIDFPGMLLNPWPSCTTKTNGCPTDTAAASWCKVAEARRRRLNDALGATASTCTSGRCCSPIRGYRRRRCLHLAGPGKKSACWG